MRLIQARESGLNHVKKVTPGFRPILISEEAFDRLKKLQRHTYGHHDPNGVRFDLKDVVSALVLEALEIEDMPSRALGRAARSFVESIQALQEKAS